MTHPNKKSNSHTRLILSPISFITKLYWCSLLNVMNLSPHSTVAVNALVWAVKSSPCNSLLTYHSVYHPFLPPSVLPEAARRVALKHKSNHITPLPKLSQCFPIVCGIKYKLPGLVCQTFHNLALIVSQAFFIIIIISILCPDTPKSVEAPRWIVGIFTFMSQLPLPRLPCLSAPCGLVIGGESSLSPPFASGSRIVEVLLE